MQRFVRHFPIYSGLSISLLSYLHVSKYMFTCAYAVLCTPFPDIFWSFYFPAVILTCEQVYVHTCTCSALYTIFPIYSGLSVSLLSYLHVSKYMFTPARPVLCKPFFRQTQVVLFPCCHILLSYTPIPHRPESHELTRIDKYLDSRLNRTQFVKVLTDSHSP